MKSFKGLLSSRLLRIIQGNHSRNLAALQCPHVDILAHPGLLSPEEAKIASNNDIFLEISARQGHCLTNGHIASLARSTGAKLLLGSDAHSEHDLLTPSLANAIIRGTGLVDTACHQVLVLNPEALMKKILPSEIKY